MKTCSHFLFWSIARITLILSTVAFFLYLNATKFDHTEIRAIIEIAVGLLLLEVIQNRMQNKKK
jgi:glucose uptake protein GlcU